MAILHKSLVKEVASNKPNASTAFNLPDSAPTGYRSFDSAYATNDQCPYFATNGTAWESGIGTFTAGTPDTLARTTLLESSTGSAIDFSSGGDVAVEVQWIAGLANYFSASAFLENKSETVTTANITGEVGKLHVCACSGLTASRDFILPDSANVGDRVGVVVTSVNSDYELLLKPAASDTINGNIAGEEWSRLLLVGEVVIFRCVTANSAWIVEYDGRIQSLALQFLTANATGETAGTFTKPTDKSGTWSAQVTRGITNNASTGRITVRRPGYYQILAQGRSANTITYQKYFAAAVYINGAINNDNTQVAPAAQVIKSQVSSPIVSLATGDYVELYYRSEEGSKGCRGDGTFTTHIAVKEQL